MRFPSEPDQEAAVTALEQAEGDGLPAAVAGLVECVLTGASVKPWGAFSIGDTQAVALLHLATAIGGAEGASMLARAAGCADDGRVLAAIASQAEPPLQAEVVSEAVAAFRAVEQQHPGAVVHLVTLAGLGDDAALLAEAAAAGRRRPAMLGDLARGELGSVWPHVGKPAPASCARALWELTSDWEVWPRLELRVRLAPRLPAAERAAAVHATLDELRAMVAGPAAPAGAGHALALLAPHLDVADVDVAVGLLPRLGLRFAADAVALRQIELGMSVERAFALLEPHEECDVPWYWRAVAQALGLRDNEELAQALADHLETLGDSGASLFIEAYAPALVRGLDTRRLLAIVAAMAPAERVLGQGVLAPYLPARRDELLAEGLAIASSLSPYHANLHVFVNSAPWLADEDAKWVLASLLEWPAGRSAVLVGDEGDPHVFPGVAQLVPLLQRLGGTATVSATARVVASLGRGDRG